MTDKQLTNRYAHVREDFCLANFILPGAVWFDVMALRPMSNDRIARLELTNDNGWTTPTSGHFCALSVRIVHVITGEIDRKLFSFQDHLVERSDERADYDRPPHVSQSGPGQFGWYIAVPTEEAKHRLMKSIADYIAVWEGDEP